MSDLKLKQTVEGKTKLFVPDLKHYKRKEDAPVFYNPTFSKDRDLSVKIFNQYFEEAHVADILCGLGARGIRYANECNFDVELNDASPTAVKLAEKNAKENKVKVKTSNDEANRFLLKDREEKFDIIDIDPFGSPVYFLETAFRAIKPKNSILAVSATDLGALSGYYPKACFRRYNINTGVTSFSHELGVRNLISKVSMYASKYEYAIKPIFAYHYRHYYRLYLEIISGKKNVNRDLRKLGYYLYCEKCDNRETTGIFKNHKMKCSCGSEFKKYGPTWLSKLGNYEFMKKIDHEFINKEELKFDDPYINLHQFAKKHSTPVLKTQDAIDKLKENGYRATASMFCPYSIKANTDFRTAEKILIS